MPSAVDQTTSSSITNASPSAGSSNTTTTNTTTHDVAFSGSWSGPNNIGPHPTTLDLPSFTDLETAGNYVLVELPAHLAGHQDVKKKRPHIIAQVTPRLAGARAAAAASMGGIVPKAALTDCGTELAQFPHGGDDEHDPDTDSGASSSMDKMFALDDIGDASTSGGSSQHGRAMLPAGTGATFPLSSRSPATGSSTYYDLQLPQRQCVRLRSPLAHRRAQYFSSQAMVRSSPRSRHVLHGVGDAAHPYNTTGVSRGRTAHRDAVYDYFQ
ncbi:hypothetical protein B0H63DRAFT_524701 [Podospora didyma]|uniref:Uncharacterized protein n=1 Tax=Podospora didyma TaxID=330526 RepID=A0AAE0NIB1_9PEZI|nr:hypothetical protein B0H63DRAFT_524701 [Podospora didyma]